MTPIFLLIITLLLISTIIQTTHQTTAETLGPIRSISVLSGQCVMSWNELSSSEISSSPNLTIHMESTASGNKYCAMAFSSSSMDGEGVGLIVLSSGETQFRPLSLSPYSASAKALSSSAPEITILSSTYNSASSWEVNFTVSHTYFSGISTIGDQRMIFGMGTWDTTNNFPQKHTAKTAATVNLYESGATPVPATTLAPPTTTPVTNSVTHFGGQMVMEWSLDDTNMTVTMTSKSVSTYCAFAWANSGMAGKGVALFVNSGGTPYYRVFDSYSYGISTTASTGFYVLSASYSGSEWQMQVTFPKALFPALSSSGSKRMIFARGNYNTGSNMPNQHSTSADRTAAFVDVYAGTASADDSSSSSSVKYPNFMYAMLASFIVCLVMAGVGAGLKEGFLETSHPSTQLAARLLVYLILLIQLVLVFIAAREDFLKKKVTAPNERAIGASICHPFMLLLLPTTKYLNIGHLAGSSYERFINFHVVGGISVLVLMIIHFSVMVSFFNRAAPEIYSFGNIINGGKDKGFNTPILPAFVALILLIVVFIFAALRRKFYGLFRISHVLVLVVIILCCIHFNPLAFVLIPGLLIYVTDLVLYKFIFQAGNNAKIVSSNYFSEAKVTELKIELDDDEDNKSSLYYYEQHPGQFCFLTMSKVSLMPHPFSIANVEQTNNSKNGKRKTLLLTFLIKDLGSYTNSVGTLAAQKALIGSSISITRPIGHLGTSLDVAPNCFLCAGGIGITPILSMARFVFSSNTTANFTTLQNVNLIWCVREQELIDVVYPILKQISTLASQNTNKKINLNISIYCTCAKNGEMKIISTSSSHHHQNNKKNNDNKYHRNEQHQLVSVSDSVSPREGEGRAVGVTGFSPTNNTNNNDDENDEAEADDVDEKNANKKEKIGIFYGNRPSFNQIFGVDGRNVKKLTMSLFSCGPSTFMESAREAASKCDAFIHEETFEL